MYKWIVYNVSHLFSRPFIRLVHGGCCGSSAQNIPHVITTNVVITYIIATNGITTTLSQQTHHNEHHHNKRHHKSQTYKILTLFYNSFCGLMGLNHFLLHLYALHFLDVLAFF